MRAKKGFNLRRVCGENIIVAEGKENIDFCNIIGLNESAAYLWTKAQSVDDFTTADLAHWLTDEYEVDEATASADAEAVARQWLNAGIIDAAL